MTRCESRLTLALVSALFLSAALAAPAHDSGKAVIEPVAGLKWTVGGAPQVSTCAVEGDMTKGASHFFLKYAAGFVTPPHHHSADHYAAMVSGTMVLIVDGKENRLSPGSYFSLTGKTVHSARCEGPDDCVMFLDARGPWDAVMVEKAPPKP
jgi:quercetin dioxygenase-like cupin family protein